MKILFSIILGMALGACPLWAQEDNMATATSALQDVLSNLKQSAQELSLANDQLVARDNTMRKQVQDLQQQLGQIVAQGDLLNKNVVKLQEKDSGRSQQINRLEEENYDLDNSNQKTEAGINIVQQSLDAGYKEIHQLLLQLNELKNSVPSAGGDQSQEDLETQEASHREKEKLKLMKMIYDCQQRQAALHESIMEFQQNTPLQPAASALAHQGLIKEQIKDLETQIAAFPPEKPSDNDGNADQWNDDQVHQLQDELKVLEHNYAQLKDLTQQMSKKNQSSRMTVSERVEGDKLQSSLDELKRQGVGLRADLDDLRSQMIELDKRKTHLDSMVEQMQ